MRGKQVGEGIGNLSDPILDTALFRLPLRSGEPGPSWTVRRACEGTQVFGATGSGKTSGSGRTLALAMLRAAIRTGLVPNPIRFGGLVLTAKPDELGVWVGNQPEHDGRFGYCQLADREHDVVVLGTDLDRYLDWGLPVLHDEAGQPRPYRFNFLDYERTASPQEDLVANIVAVFMTALGSERVRSSNADPYWEDALRQLLINAVDLVLLARGRVSMDDITKVILTAPQSRDQARSGEWQRTSDCWRCLDEANAREDLKPPRREDLRQVVHYWLLDFAGLTERTRSVVVSSFTSKATALLRSPLRELLAAGETDADVMPEASMRGKIIILDLSVKRYGEVGRFAQVLYKTVWQRAIERRTLSPQNPSPVFLWADESQHFVTREDVLFQQTARSALAASVYLTQNLPNYYAVMEARDSRAATDSLLGNFHTKIFHVNGDPVTNEWAERLFGRVLRTRTAQQLHYQPESHGQQQQGQAGDRQSYGTSSQPSWEPRVPAIEFTQLRKGGPPDFISDAIVWLDGSPFLASFSQRTMPEAP